MIKCLPIDTQTRIQTTRRQLQSPYHPVLVSAATTQNQRETLIIAIKEAGLTGETKVRINGQVNIKGSITIGKVREVKTRVGTEDLMTEIAEAEIDTIPKGFRGIRRNMGRAQMVAFNTKILKLRQCSNRPTGF